MGGPSGRSGGDGWFLEGTGEDPTGDRNASIHESFHHRLDRSTNFGALMLAYAGLVKADVGDRRVLEALRDSCRTVHESAATYLTSISLSHLDDRTTYSSHYRRYLDGMRELVGGDEPPAWARFHVALAVSRACLQPFVADVVGEVGLGSIRSSSFRNAALADERFRRLRSLPPDMTSVDALAANAAGLDVADPRRTGDVLEASWFDRESHDVYELYETAAWAEVSNKLAKLGCEVDAIDAHLPLSAALLDEGRSLGGVYDIVATTQPRPPSDRVWGALAPLDHESITLPARRSAHSLKLADVNGDLGLLSAGAGDNEHLHLSIRPKSQFEHYDWSTETPISSVCLRRTLETESGRSIEHTSMAGVDPNDLRAGWDGPIVATISESQLLDPEVMEWRRTYDVETVLLCDTPLIPRLKFWSSKGWFFRFMFLSLQAADATSPMMVARFESSDGTSSTPIAKPMTPQVVNTIRQALGELDSTGLWTKEDNNLGHDLPSLGLALFHIIGEDLRFGLTQPGNP